MSRTERLGLIEDMEKTIRDARRRLNISDKQMIEALPELAKVWMRFALLYLEDAANALMFAREALPEGERGN